MGKVKQRKLRRGSLLWKLRLLGWTMLLRKPKGGHDPPLWRAWTDHLIWRLGRWKRGSKTSETEMEVAEPAQLKIRRKVPYLRPLKTKLLSFIDPCSCWELYEALAVWANKSSQQQKLWELLYELYELVNCVRLSSILHFVGFHPHQQFENKILYLVSVQLLSTEPAQNNARLCNPLMGSFKNKS